MHTILHRIATARRWQTALAALAAGALAALGQAPWGLWPATLAGLALLFALLRHAPTWRRAALLGWAWATGHFLLALSWLVEPFLVDVARHGWMAPFALGFMAGGLGLLWAAGAALGHRAGGAALSMAAALCLTEALRGTLFSGFPWAQPGHVWVGTPLMPLAAFVGALGLTALTLVLAALLLRSAAQAALSLALLAALWLALPQPASGPPAPDAPTVRLIQPNAAQHEKWDPAMIPVFFRRQLDFTSAPGVANQPAPALIVWPETAIPSLLNHAGDMLAAIHGAAGATPVILGAQRYEGARLFNSLVLLSDGGAVSGVYDKHHLVPFGEYIPLGDLLGRFGISGLAAREGNGYSSGPGPALIDLGPLGLALPLICYEGVFPRNLGAAPGRADFVLLITNDAWFGQVSGPYQHLAQARLRSVEQGLPMIRVANTGISAMIDAQGMLTASLPLGEAGFVDAPLPPPLPPTLYARTGDWPLLLVLAIVLGGAFVTQRARTRLSD